MNAFTQIEAYLHVTTAPQAIRTSPDHRLSDQIADARAALCCPYGATDAELAGAVMLLAWHGTEDDQRNAADFAATMPYRADLAAWTDYAMVPTRQIGEVCLPALDNPRRGVIRAELPRFAALVGFCAAVLTVVYVGGPL